MARVVVPVVVKMPESERLVEVMLVPFKLAKVMRPVEVTLVALR